jgi:NADPH:quinone reductase-like Zn-dependent oxidoreductase
MTVAAIEQTSMRAILRRRYAAPGSLTIGTVEKPELSDDGVLVRVRASSVNRGDFYMVTGSPWFARTQLGGFRPKSPLIGTDFAGVVEAVGTNVADFAPGDEVFGGRSGAFAEYVVVKNGIAHKPANITFEEAAAVPVAALTALQALRDKGGVQAGESVLVNGASGGVGTYLVQIAKAFEVRVTAVCSTRNVEAVRALGADRVVDYTKEDFTRTGDRYDLICDNAGSRSWSELKRVMKPGTRVVMVGAPKGGPILGPLGHIARTWIASRLRGPKATFFVASFSRENMAALAGLLESGRVHPVVERTYRLDEVPQALEYMGEGHAQGKLVITI